MANRWNEIKALRPVSGEAFARAHVENLADDFGMALSELRRGEGLTQVELAHRLLVTQPTVSEIERTGSPSVPTVRRYVEALGARLELVAVFDDDRRVAFDPAPLLSAADTRHSETMRAGANDPRTSGRPSRRGKEYGMAGKTERTGKPAAAAAAKTLASKSAGKAAKSAAGSALSQKPTRRSK